MRPEPCCAESVEDLLPLLAQSARERSGDLRLPLRVRVDPDCAFCRKNRQIYLADDEYEHPEPTFIKRLPASVAALSYEQDYPGRSVVVLRDHETSLSYLLEHKLILFMAFMEDVSAVSDAIYRALRPAKVNYMVLMNQNDHFHMHLIPRYMGEGEKMHAPPVFRGTTELQPGVDYRSLALRIRHGLRPGRSAFSACIGEMIDAGLPEK